MQEDAAAGSSWPPLLPGCATYRAILKPNMIAGGQVRALAFMRRPPHPITGVKRDVEGLSVALAGDRDEATTAAAEASQFNRCVAVCCLTVGKIRGIETEPGLDVVQDAPYHANVTGLPEMPAEADLEADAGRAARARAEFLGGELAQEARIVWRREAD